MDCKRRRMIEGLLYLFSLPRNLDKATISEALNKALKTAKCGRVLGSGTSLVNDGTVAIEIGAYDLDEANDTISSVCRRLNCRDFEIAWD